MPRPCKQRRICGLPRCGRFGPRHAAGPGPVTLQVDEFECIRLIDLAGMTQEQCAAQMNVARATVQAIYNSARAKLAECLVNQRELLIEGGDYVLCDGHPGQDCPNLRSGHCRRITHEKENGTMKIAVTFENGQIFQHFGHTAQFKVYTVQDGAVTASEVVSTNGSGHGALAGFLRGLGVDTLICGGIGGGARQALDMAGIRLFGGVQGDADQAVQALLAGSLSFDPDVLCHHHDSEQGGHSCGSHSCGGHSCEH